MGGEEYNKKRGLVSDLKADNKTHLSSEQRANAEISNPNIIKNIYGRFELTFPSKP